MSGTTEGHAMDDRTAQEERLAHLERMLADLSDVVARQDREIDRLTRRVEFLLSRDAEWEIEAGGSVVLSDRKPPHR